MSAAIELRRVVKRYEGGAVSYTALKDVDLTVEPGEFVAVVGKSGSGKSTLINMIAGIDRPTSGEVVVDGVPVHALREGQMAGWRARSIGVVFQFFQLLPSLTLLENVMLPMDLRGGRSRRQQQERALDLLERVGMVERWNRLPALVSGGQQQRVAIARALANDPPILVADEPTGSLDSAMAESVVLLFESLVRAGKTIVMVTHDPILASRAGRTVTVADGDALAY